MMEPLSVPHDFFDKCLDVCQACTEGKMSLLCSSKADVAFHMPDRQKLLTPLIEHGSSTFARLSKEGLLKRMLALSPIF